MAEPRVDRASIVSAARALLESGGSEALSMRRLAAALGSKPMTLYHHVGSKSELLSLVLGDIAAGIDWRPPTGPPRDRMITIGVDLYRELSAIPWIVPVLRAGTHVGTAALVVADRFAAAALELGASELQALSAYRSVWYLVSSQIEWDTELAGRAEDETSWFQRMDPAALSGAPVVAELLPRWPQLSRDFDLRAAITAQIDGAILVFGGPPDARG
jgi:AcrR family transcriptional regulator